MYSNFQIDSAEALVKGFAILIRDGQSSLEDVQKLIMEISGGNEGLTQMVLEKTNIQLESMRFFAAASMA